MIGDVVVSCLVGKYSRDNVLDILCECISREENDLFIVVTYSFPFRLHSHKVIDDRMTVMISA